MTQNVQPVTVKPGPGRFAFSVLLFIIPPMFDALTARAVAAELQEKIARGRVQAVVSLDELTLGFEIYAQHARHYLLASADPTTSRIQLVVEKLRSSGAPPTTFTLLLKKYADGAFVNRIEAVPYERILRLEFDHAEYGVATFVAEVMGRLSNLILLDATGTVLDAVKRVTPAMSRARAVLPKEKYVPPPPQAKIAPLMLSTPEFARILEQARGEPLWQTLVRTVAGTSPVLARELAFRVSGDAEAEANPAWAESLRAALFEIWRTPAEPTIAYEGEQPVAVAAFALTHWPKKEHLDSMSAALEKYFGAVESYAAVKEPMRRRLAEGRERLARKVGALRREIISEAELERYKTSGELILAYQYQVKPGQKVLRAERLEGEPLQIKLDPNLTPIENAQKYFAEYRHAKDAAATVPARLQEAEADLEFADEVLEDLEMAETRGEIDAVLSEAREAGLMAEARGPKPSATPSQPRVFTSPDGFQILVGRNARQNDEVTFVRAGAEDIWLHARGVAGAHVVILGQGREVPESTIEFAAGLAAYYSKGREDTRVDVVVVSRKNVRHVAGRAARPGLVTVRGERTVRVRPTLPTEE